MKKRIRLQFSTDVTLLANPGFMRIKLSIHNAAQGVLLC
jgi:hypothetical protein